MLVFKKIPWRKMRNGRGGASVLLGLAVLVFLAATANLLTGTKLSMVRSGQFTAVFLVLSLPFWSFKRTRAKAHWWLYVLFFVCSIAYFFAIGVQAVIGTVDVDAILYHAQAGVAGFGGNHVKVAQQITAGTWLALLLISLLAFLRSRFGPAYIFSATLLMLGLNPIVHYGVAGLAYRAGFNRPETPLQLAALYDPALEMVPPITKKNLVIVYLEGLERTYGDDSVFQGSYDDIAALGREGITFSGIDQIASTGWSIAGITASQCGVPLFRYGAISDNNYDQLKTFLPQVTCLGDLLSAAGYQQEFIVGHEIKFAGTDNFLYAHGYDKTRDIDSIDHTGKTARKGTLYDDAIFQTARRELLKLKDADQPFSLVLETIAPHGPYGWISRACRAPGQPGRTENILLAVACLGRETSDFVKFVQQTVDMENTVIVLLSDHLGHRNNMTDALEAHNRRNTAIMLGGGISADTVAKRGAMIDIAPTLLEVLGYTLPDRRFNLGVSLLSDTPTHLETFGLPDFNREIQYDHRFADSLWAEE